MPRGFATLCSRPLDFFERPRFGNSTIAVKALLRIKLVMTPMRAEDTVISSRTRGLLHNQGVCCTMSQNPVAFGTIV
eukprot:1582666-Prymnesium_polylepis.1